ncbi:hypothetical protein [Streptomyces sp. NPDC055036]
MTTPDDLVHQGLPALEAARIYGVRCELDGLVYFTSLLAVPAEHRPLAKEN